MIIEILGLVVIVNLITHWFTPIQSIKNKLLLFINSEALTTVFTCPKCLGLYLGTLACFLLIDYNNFHLLYILTFGPVVSFLSYLLKFIIDFIEHYYES